MFVVYMLIAMLVGVPIAGAVMWAVWLSLFE